jgi:sugar (pentulose or hexulose) kinase
MAQLSNQLQPAVETGLDYIPLLKPGERFPINDPNLQPRLTPRPDSDSVFFQGMLEAIAASEARAYGLLADLGASPVKRVLTAGGGSRNAKWMEIRSRMLGGVPVEVSPQGEAAYGAAVLARQGYVQWARSGEEEEEEEDL